MNNNMAAAYIMAQASMLNARIAMMKAANTERERAGMAPAYGEEAFSSLIEEYDTVLSHNSVVEFFQGVYQ